MRIKSTVAALLLVFSFALTQTWILRTAEAQLPLNGGFQIRHLEKGQWLHLAVGVDDWENLARFRLLVVSGNPDLYVRYGQQPTLKLWDFRPYQDPVQSKSAIPRPVVQLHETVVVNDDSEPGIQSGNYYYSVHARTNTKFVISGKSYSLASEVPGGGAVVQPERITFRTWAPFADTVNVAGSFNAWNANNIDLQPEGNGFWSVDIRNVGAEEQYKFVIRNDGQTLWKNDPYALKLQNSVGNSVTHDPSFPWSDQDFVMPNWNELVVYEMHVGTVNDEPGGSPGNFDDAIDRLDDIAAIGVNALKVMPVNEFPGDFSWGYNPSYPFSVESAYGGPDAFKRFVDAAHARGMAVLLDVVHNHYGPGDLDLWRYDGWYESIFGGIFFYQDERSFTPWGDTRPDYGRGEVRQYIRDNAVMWIQDYHVDGFRWDSTSNIRTTILGDNPEGWSLMQWINNEIDAIDPSLLSVAEDLQSNDFLTRPTAQGGAGFDSQWTPSFVHPIRDVIVPPGDDGRNMWAVRDAIEHRYNGDAFERVVYTESHDEVANGRARVPEEIFPGNADSYWSQKRSTLGAALVMTSPGIPMIFQGQELLEDGFFQDTDPVDWSRKVTFSGIRQMYTDLIRLRRNWFDHTRGLRGQHVNVFHVNNGDKMVAFHRWQNGGPRDDVIVVCNFRNQAWSKYRIGFPRSGVWRVRFNGDFNGYSEQFSNYFSPDVTTINEPRDGLNYSGIIEVGPYTTLILSQD